MTLSRPTFRLALVLAALLLALPWAASAQSAGAADSEDPTNPSYELDMLEDGDTSEGVLGADVSAQLFGFLGSAGDVVTISMTQAEDSALDPYLVLLGPAGQVIAKDDDSGEAAFSAQIAEVELPVNGSYFIIASSFSAINGVGFDETAEVEDADFTITLTGNTVPPEEESQFFSSRLEDGVATDGYSTLEEPVYYFTYVVLPDEPVTVDVTVTSEEFDTLVMVFGPGGLRLAFNDDGEGIGTDSAVSGVELAEAGKYLVFATDVAFPNAGIEDAVLEYKGGDFVITLSESAGLSK